LFGSVIAVAFQIAFHAEIYINDVFLFSKNHFWHQHIKTIQKVQIALNFSKKKNLKFDETQVQTQCQMFSIWPFIVHPFWEEIVQRTYFSNNWWQYFSSISKIFPTNLYKYWICLEQKHLRIQFLPPFISSQPFVSHGILGLHYNKWCRWRYWLLFKSHEKNQSKMMDPIQRNSSLFSSRAYLATISSNSIAASIPVNSISRRTIYNSHLWKSNSRKPCIIKLKVRIQEKTPESLVWNIKFWWGWIR